MNKQMPRVLYSFPHRLGMPGIGTTAWHQVANLVALGVPVKLFCGSCERNIEGEAEIRQTMRFGPVKVPYRLFGEDRIWAAHDRIVAHKLRKLKNSIDVIHCWPLGSLQTIETAKALGIKTLMERPNTHTQFAYDVVAKEHRIINVDIPRRYTHAFNSARLSREESEYSSVDKIACPSEFVAKTFLRRGFSESKIAYHQYGYDPELFEIGNPERSNRLGLSCIFVGRCEPRKGLHYALQAWHNSGAAEKGIFRICGSFIPGYKKTLQSLLDHPSVIQLGYVPDVHKVMKKSDILILPSIEEGSALVTYEGRACGCVLVVSDATGAHCCHMQDALVHSAGDVEMLTKHLRMLSSNTNLLGTLRNQSISGLPTLTWHEAAKRLLQIYRQMCGML